MTILHDSRLWGKTDSDISHIYVVALLFFGTFGVDLYNQMTY